MKKIVLLLLLILSISCEQQNIDLQHLPGYWEIKKVESKEGKSKEFKINQTVDFIVVEDTLGFRKKLKPLFSGKYEGSKDVEKFSIQNKEGRITLHYTTPYDNWKEEILMLTDEQLVVKNEANLTYTYQRYQSLIEFDEE